jgi:DNA topoisomerase II
MSTTTNMSSSTAAAPKYQKLSHREHVLQLPDTYIGSVETHDEWRWVLGEAGHMEFKRIPFNPGFYKIFDELVVNARDALVRSRLEKGRMPVKTIEVTVKKDGDTVVITVENDGDGIPVEPHATEKGADGKAVWVPELIFGHLLTSGNYDKGEEKIVGGKNGYGSKVCNIFSKCFDLEVVSPAQGKKYVQRWTDNMSVCGKPNVSVVKRAVGYVRVAYTPDLARFPGLDLDVMTQVLHTRTVELAALAGKDVKVKWQGEAVATNTFEKFVRLFLKEERTGLAMETCGPRWEVAAVLARNLYSEEEGVPDDRHVSFVNGINTRKGGKHVETVVRHVLGDFCEAAAKKKVTVKPAQLKDCVVFFVNATIVNPSFDSQTKETLTTPANKFGSAFKTEGKLVDGLMKIGLLEEARSILEAKEAKDAKKTDGTKKKTLRGYPKLEDALWAGTAKSRECTLILTEGDSAASSAIAGLAIVGRERFGVFPLKGKMLNVKDISQEKFNKNEELTAIKAILGLRQGQKYKDTAGLRYGRVMVMADQDHDGSHIKGLLMNLFHTEWPELMRMGFLCSLATPILKASRRSDTLSFYSMAEFERWKEAQGAAASLWKLKYYKGLGTSTPAEAREWFKAMTEILYEWDEATDNAMSLAFHKKRADDRKEWLANYDARRMNDVGAGGRIGYTAFVDNELIHFSNADNLRSLPHIMDGLKPSQRKILFGCFKRNLTEEVRVAQLAGYVSEHAAYHHGEASLTATITGMAQDFMGANNINLLVPVGQFGSRLLGGKDAASPRYIHTYLQPIVSKLFRKEDAGILQHLEDDGLKVEPETYLPVMPMLLVNGCVGIGTGFSTDIPPYNPSELSRVLKERLLRRLPSMRMVPLKPWWFGFKGTVSGEDGTWTTRGVYEMDHVRFTITITELPVGVWTKDYKAFLDELASEPSTPLKHFDDLYTDTEVKFILYFTEDQYEDYKAHPEDFEKKFRMTSTWRTSNMVAFNKDMRITKYATVGDILEDFYDERLRRYEERRQKEMARLEDDAELAENTAKFLRAVLAGRIDLRQKTDEQIVEMMKAEKLAPLSKRVEHQRAQQEGGATAGGAGDVGDGVEGYEYVLRLRMDRVKQTAVEQQEAAVVASRAAVEALRGTTAAQLWLKDLEEFDTAWEKMMAERVAAASAVGPRAGGKKKAVRSK